MAIKSREPYDVQTKIISKISVPSPDIESIVNKSASYLLTNDEIRALIEFMANRRAYSLIRTIVTDPSMIVPAEHDRWKCRMCHTPQKGVIFDRSTRAGELVRKFGIQHLSEVCFKIKNDQAPS